MKHLLLMVVSLIAITVLNGQKNEYAGLSIYNTQSALPFGKFSGLFAGPVHPGIEALYGRNLISRNNHDWFLEVKFSYFFHRYVQHAIPVYLNFGYRYKVNNKFSAEASVGGGYMHSVAATAKLKLNENGDYINNKGVGRMQAIATCAFGLGYTPQSSGTKPLTVFMNYQQRVQMPFVRSYVPLLPYNSFMVGVKRPIDK